MSRSAAPTDTIAAIATPTGTGGIGVVRVSGPEALAIALRVARLPHDRKPRPRYAHVARVVDPEDDERLVDEGLLLFFRAPRSYTGENVVELHGHGGSVVQRRVLDLVLRAGARMADPGEFTLRGFLNGRIDLAQAEAVAEMVAAPTAQALAAAASQLAGRLSQAVREIRQGCLSMLAQLEAEIDFAEEDVPPMPRATAARQLDRLLERLAELLAGADRGILQRHGLRVAIVGSPNVGKSSLMNALLNADRAIVTDVPGTTRDTLDEAFNLDGIPIVLTDTAGMRRTRDQVERLGVERSSRALESADVAVLVLDASRTLSATDTQTAELVCAARKPTIAVLNKRDLPAVTPVAEAAALVPDASLCHTAATGADVEQLRAALRALVDLRAPPGELATLSNVRHKQALQRANTELQSSARAVADELPADFVTIGLHGAVRALGEVTGESATEELLDAIFTRFCIGK